MRKRLLITGSSAFVLAIIAVSGVWVFMARNTEQAIVDWMQPNNAIHITGFPFRVSARVENPIVLSIRQGNLDHWQAPELTAEFFLFSPRRVKFSAPGRHILTLKADWAGSDTVVVDALEAWLEVHRSKTNEIDELKMNIRGMTTQFGDDRTLKAGAITLEFQRRAAGHEQVSPEVASAILRLVMTSLELPLGMTGPFEPVLDHVEIDIAVSGTLATDANGWPTRSDLDNWRTQGGFIQIRSLKFDWDGLSIEASGQIELDQDLQPIGSLDARAAGLTEFIGRLERTGLVEPDKLMVARLAILGLNALSGNRNEPGEDFVSLPVSVRNNGLYLGPIKLTEFGRLSWGE